MSAEWLDSSGLNPRSKEKLSALADGEMRSEECGGILSALKDDDDVQSHLCSTWHAYHLIGDVMRSEDLSGQGRDEAFLRKFRERLVQEPVVVAPAAPLPLNEPVALEAPVHAVASGGARRRRTWAAPVAAAAGVMAVAGVLVVTRVPPGASPAPVLAQSGAAATLVVAAEGPASASRVLSEGRQVPAVVNGTVIRDARLDQYLSAHKQFGGSSALGVPSGFLRSATYEGPSR